MYAVYVKNSLCEVLINPFKIQTNHHDGDTKHIRIGIF